MSALNERVKIRSINRETLHPAEMGQFLIENADRIESGVVVLNYKDGEKEKTQESYIGGWMTRDLAWWVACLQDTLFRNMRE